MVFGRLFSGNIAINDLGLTSGEYKSMLEYLKQITTNDIIEKRGWNAQKIQDTIEVMEENAGVDPERIPKSEWTYMPPEQVVAFMKWDAQRSRVAATVSDGPYEDDGSNAVKILNMANGVSTRLINKIGNDSNAKTLLNEYTKGMNMNEVIPIVEPVVACAIDSADPRDPKSTHNKTVASCVLENMDDDKFNTLLANVESHCKETNGKNRKMCNEFEKSKDKAKWEDIKRELEQEV